jgi:hypothetical protein
MVKLKRENKSANAPSLLKKKMGFNISFYLAIALFVAGQIAFFVSSPAVGIFLSIFAVALGVVIYAKGDRFSLPEVAWGQVLPKVDLDLHLPSISPKNKKIKKEVSPSKVLWKLDAFKPIYSISVVGVALSFVLAGAGQAFFRQAGNDSTLVVGGWLFIIASVLFVASLWPWFREGLKTIPLSFKTEMIALGAILVLALFLRVYHIASMPQGLFIDQGFVGYSALRILHEGYRPWYISEIFLMAYSFAVYLVAFWFKIFGAGEITLKLFYVFLSMLGLPLIYWTFRQLAGVRAALITLFVLAVMRWHIIFSRNAFPTIQVPLYVFGTLAFLLYGINNGKKWAFAVAGLFFALGFYTYQGFKVTPVLLLVYAIYEACADWKRVKRNWKKIVGFLVVAFVITAPILYDWTANKNFGDRESQLSVFSKIRAEHSIKPFWEGLVRTSLMFNRQGDPNPRHNLQDYRMLDDVSGALFILGLVYGIFHIKRRKYFYAVMGFFVMSLLCILTIDPAHANRLLALTPFLAFLIATPISVVWGRVLRFAGPKAEWVFLLILAPFLWMMVSQNFDVYFNKQANNIACWHEYAARETNIGRRIAQYGTAYDYLIAPPFMGYHTINFLGYKELNQIHSMIFPDALISHPSDSSRGAYFAVEDDRPAVLAMLKSFYPDAIEEPLIDPDGGKALYFLKVPPDQLKKVLGLKAVFDRPVNGVREMQIDQFPNGLPKGPYRVTLTGNLYIDQTDGYQWTFGGNVRPTLWIGHQLASVAGYQHLDKGYHPLKIQLNVSDGEVPALTIQERHYLGMPTALTSGYFNTLPTPRGLKGSYYRDALWDKAKPFEVQWDPIIDYADGNEFPVGPIYSIHWTGTLLADQSGNYEIYIQTRASAGLKIDGKTWFNTGSAPRGKSYLKAGPHSIDIYYSNPAGGFPYFALYWLKPDGTSQVIPNSAFGAIP